MGTPNGNGNVDGSANSNSNPSMQVYQRQIEELKELLSAKDQTIEGLQQGLDAQVHMVMELEELEQKELREYELKIAANKRLIGELGERVGQESKEKAELESQLQYERSRCRDQQHQIESLTELHEINNKVFQAFKEDIPDKDRSSKKWEAFAKLEFMMETNQRLMLELAQAQEDKLKVKREVSDKELLCLELSSQLDKLAQQLNTADEDMATVCNQVVVKEKALQQSEDRVKMLETSMMEGPAGDEKQGISHILKTLKEKEHRCEQLQRERDASLAKATKLSLALAASRELADSLQEKLDYQNSIVDRIMGKRAAPTNVVTATKEKPQRSASFERKALGRTFSGAGAALGGQGKTPTNTPTEHNNNNNNNSSTSPPGRFDGRRIRSFFGRGRANSAGTVAAVAGPPTTTLTAHTNGNATLPLSATSEPPTTKGLFQRKTSSESSSAEIKSAEITVDLQPVPEAGVGTNPFDDSISGLFTNESVGKADHIQENCQGGGGDINLALTL